MINFLYLNVRMLGDGWNRTMKLEQLEELGKQDAILLSETKCKTRFEPLGKLAFQTELSGSKGSVTIFNSVNAKKVKALNENLLWTTKRVKGALVHYLLNTSHQTTRK